MKDIYVRTEKLVGEDGLERLRGAKVLCVGLGGVGGYVFEALCRAGVGVLGLCDFDTVDPTNLNRQILALEDTVGMPKTRVAEERAAKINPDCSCKVFSFRLTDETLPLLDIPSWDFVCDAIDDVHAKLSLIAECYSRGVPVISSMGTGNKLDPFSYRITPIEKTEVDPLARAMRRKLKDMGIKGVPVLWSSENNHVGGIEHGEPIPSISYMPAAAGLMIASYVIRQLTGK